MRALCSVCILAAAFFAGPAAAINKCTGPGGKIVFQDTPCAGQGEQLLVKPAAGASPSSAPAGTSEAQRLEGIVSNSQRDRRRQDLRDKWIPEAQVALTGHRAGCEQRQKELAASQYAYKQNLYGKTHAAQMASEMAAAAATCDTKDRELKDKLDALDRECATLQCR
jgi:hypothetical protein